jgi:uncharacterized protein with NRDE domain
MCLVALAIDQHPRFPLVIAANRDEFRDRPAQPLDWWSPGDDAPDILGGRDLRAGGTWLGLTAAGRLAFLTNVRNPARHDPASPSRGAIVPMWLRGDMPIDRFWMHVSLSGYNGFNLVAADFAAGECFWASNTGELPQRLGQGLWALSNASLDTPWPKAQALKRRCIDALQRAMNVEALAALLFDALADRRVAPDDALPATGVPIEWERALSPAFIYLPEQNYGTRCSTLVIGERLAHGALHTHVLERTFNDDGGTALRRHIEVPGWPPRAYNERTISTWGMPASSNTGPRSTNPARA